MIAGKAKPGPAVAGPGFCADISRSKMSIIRTINYKESILGICSEHNIVTYVFILPIKNCYK